jgi:hypothetical protein
VLCETFSGNVFDLKVGAMTLVDMVVAALMTRSGSMRIFGRFGAIEARMPTTSSDLGGGRDEDDLWSLSAAFSEMLSENPIGLVVNIAVSNRRKRS